MGTKMTGTTTIRQEALYSLRSAVEAADTAWFEALRSGADGRAEAAGYKAAKAAYRELESALIAAGTTETCGKCGGDGVVHYGRVFFTTNHGAERTCFACGGAKVRLMRPYKFSAMAPTRLKHVREYEAKKAVEAAEATAKWAAFEAAEPEVAAFLAPHVFPEGCSADEYYEDEHDEFLCSLHAAVLKRGQLTEKQMAAARRSMERGAAEAKAAEAGPLEGGTRTVRGEIVSLPMVRGYAGETMKALILLDSGHKILGVCSEKFWAAAENESPVGLLVEMTVTIERSDRDSGFGFYKSPKGIKILDRKAW